MTGKCLLEMPAQTMIRWFIISNPESLDALSVTNGMAAFAFLVRQNSNLQKQCMQRPSASDRL